MKLCCLGKFSFAPAERGVLRAAGRSSRAGGASEFRCRSAGYDPLPEPGSSSIATLQPLVWRGWKRLPGLAPRSHASVAAVVDFPIIVLVLIELKHFILPQQHLIQQPKDHKYLKPEFDSKLFEV